MSQTAKEGGAAGRREGSTMSNGGAYWSGFTRLCSGDKLALIVHSLSQQHLFLIHIV